MLVPSALASPSSSSACSSETRDWRARPSSLAAISGVRFLGSFSYSTTGATVTGSAGRKQYDFTNLAATTTHTCNDTISSKHTYVNMKMFTIFITDDSVAMTGQFELKATLDDGSTFDLTIPIRYDATSALPTCAVLQAPTSSCGTFTNTSEGVTNGAITSLTVCGSSVTCPPRADEMPSRPLPGPPDCGWVAGSRPHVPGGTPVAARALWCGIGDETDVARAMTNIAPVVADVVFAAVGILRRWSVRLPSRSLISRSVARGTAPEQFP